MIKSGALNLVKKEEVHLITLRHTKIPQGTPGDRGPIISSFLSLRLNPRWGHQTVSWNAGIWAALCENLSLSL